MISAPSPSPLDAGQTRGATSQSSGIRGDYHGAIPRMTP